MPFPSLETLQAIRKASKRAARDVRFEMSRGVGNVATIASVAPWVGMFGTVFGIVDSFGPVNGEKSAIIARLAESLSWSIWFTGLGLLVGLIALWCHRYLATRLETIDQEMDSYSLELVNQLAHCDGRFAPEPATDAPHDRPMFGERPLAELEQDRKFLRWYRVFTGAALFAAWGVQASRNFDDYSLQLHSVVVNAGIYVAFMFGLACLVAHPVWVKVLRRRHGGLAALGSALCLCWSVARLVWGGHLP